MFVAGAVLRDFETGTYELFFSRPIRKADYLLGRFLAAFGVAVVAFLGVPLGMIVGSLMPWIDPIRLGPFMPQAYLYAILVLALPNLLLSAATFFTVAEPVAQHALHLPGGRRVLRRLHPLVDPDPGHREPASSAPCWTRSAPPPSARPRGTGPSWRATRRCLPLSGTLLANRLIWLGVALGMLALALLRFRFTQPARRHGKAAPAANGTNGVLETIGAGRRQAPRGLPELQPGRGAPAAPSPDPAGGGRCAQERAVPGHPGLRHVQPPGRHPLCRHDLRHGRVACHPPHDRRRSGAASSSCWSSSSPSTAAR